jgi:hypothetical protein
VTHYTWVGDKKAEIQELGAKVRFVLWPPARLEWVQTKEEAYSHVVAPKEPLLVRDFMTREAAVAFVYEGWGCTVDDWRTT